MIRSLDTNLVSNFDSQFFFGFFLLHSFKNFKCLEPGRKTSRFRTVRIFKIWWTSGQDVMSGRALFDSFLAGLGRHWVYIDAINFEPLLSVLWHKSYRIKQIMSYFCLHWISKECMLALHNLVSTSSVKQEMVPRAYCPNRNILWAHLLSPNWWGMLYYATDMAVNLVRSCLVTEYTMVYIL